MEKSDQKDDLIKITERTRDLKADIQGYIEKHAKFKVRERVFLRGAKYEIVDIDFDIRYTQKNKLCYILDGLQWGRALVRANECDLEKIEGEDDGKQ